MFVRYLITAGRPSFILLLSVLLPACPARALGHPELSQRRLAAVTVSTPPQIDGKIDDPAWQTATRADRFSDAFNYSTEIDQTDAWICYDDAAIYVAFHCRDSQPDRIVAREIRRDANFQGEDTVSFQLDPYRTRRGDDSNFFITNALGTPSSYLAGGRAAKTEWKGEWQCAAERVEDGWVAEMRIPWRILNIPSRNGPASMGINFRRRQQRTQILSYWSNLGPQGLNQLAGDWEEVSIPRGLFKPQLSLLPFTTTGFNLGRGSAFETGLGRGRTANFGLDARLSLSPQLTLVGSANPDFSTVERAVEGIDFTRGERFVPDTRPFFLEGNDVFDVTVSGGRGWGRGFFSGRVPAFDAGAKLYGRIGEREGVGVLAAHNLHDQRTDLVGRWTHDVGAGSFIGGYLVQRALPGDSSTLVGLNESIRRGPWQVRSDVATSLGHQSGGSAGNASVRWEAPRLRLNAAYTYVQPDFRAANGFVRFTDYHGPDFFAHYKNEWRRGPLRELDLWVEGVHHARTDGRFFRRSVQLGSHVETRGDWSFRARWEGGQFESEHDSEFNLGVTRGVSNRLNRVGLNYSFGTRADLPITFLAPTFSRRLPGRIDLSLSSGILNHGGERRSLHVFGFNREIDRLRAVGGRVLVRDGIMHYFVSFRVSGGRGMETYILIGDPVARAPRSRTRFITKVVFPISL